MIYYSLDMDFINNDIHDCLCKKHAFPIDGVIIVSQMF